MPPLAFPVAMACQFVFPPIIVMVVFPFKPFQLINNLIYPPNPLFPDWTPLEQQSRAVLKSKLLTNQILFSGADEPTIGVITSCFPLTWVEVSYVLSRWGIVWTMRPSGLKTTYSPSHPLMDELIFTPELSDYMLSYLPIECRFALILKGTWELHKTFPSHSAAAFLFKKPLWPLLIWKLRHVFCVRIISPSR